MLCRTVEVAVEESSAPHTVSVGIESVISVEDTFKIVSVMVEITVVESVTVIKCCSVITVSQYPSASGVSVCTSICYRILSHHTGIVYFFMTVSVIFS